MATFNKTNTFVQAIGEKKHDLASDQIKVALSNTLPDAADAVLADITQIAYTNLSSTDVTTTSWLNTTGTSALILADLTLTASGAVAEFQYVVLYNDTATNDELIGWAAASSAVTMADGETYLIDFDATGAITIA